MFGFSSQNDTIFGALYDISSDSVGVAIVASSPEEALPKIIWAHRVRIRTADEPGDLHTRMRSMREALFSASLVLSRDGLVTLKTYKKRAKIQRVFMSCSSPWSQVVTRTVQYEGEEEMKVTRALIDDLVKSAEAEIDTSALIKDFPKDITLDIVERATVDVRINDYAIKNPLNLSGTSIALTHVTGLVPDDVIKMMYEVQEKILPSTELNTHTFMLTAYCVLREHYADTESLCIISATGETIEVGTTEGGTLIESGHIPYGSHTLLRTIVEKAKLTPSDVLTRLALYTDGTIEASALKELEAYIAPYSEQVESSLREYFSGKQIPKRIILLADPLLIGFYAKVLTPLLEKMTQSPEPITYIENDFIDEVGYNNTSDLHLSLMARFFHKLHGCGELK